MPRGSTLAPLGATLALVVSALAPLGSVPSALGLLPIAASFTPIAAGVEQKRRLGQALLDLSGARDQCHTDEPPFLEGRNISGQG